MQHLHGYELFGQLRQLRDPYSLEVRVDIRLEPEGAVWTVAELLDVVEQYKAQPGADLIEQRDGKSVITAVTNGKSKSYTGQ